MKWTIILLFILLIIGCTKQPKIEVEDAYIEINDETVDTTETNDDYIVEEKAQEDIEDTLYDDMDDYIDTDYANDYSNEELEQDLTVIT